MPSVHGRLPKQPVCARILRRIFNRRKYLEQVNRGQLLVEIESKPAGPKAGQVANASADFVLFKSRRHMLLAMAFLYRNPDGTLGGSGKADPKWIRMPNGTALYPFPANGVDPCRGCGGVHR